MSYLAEPNANDRIPVRTLGYVAEAARDDLYDLVVRKFMESGISQVTLAKRLGKSPAQICRTLGASGNWTIDTCAELLFAIDGSTLKFSHHKPLQEVKSNFRGSHCLAEYHDSVTPLVRRPHGTFGSTRNPNPGLKLHFEEA